MVLNCKIQIIKLQIKKKQIKIFLKENNSENPTDKITIL